MCQVDQATDTVVVILRRGDELCRRQIAVTRDHVELIVRIVADIDSLGCNRMAARLSKLFHLRLPQQAVVLITIHKIVAARNGHP